MVVYISRKSLEEQKGSIRTLKERIEGVKKGNDLMKLSSSKKRSLSTSIKGTIGSWFMKRLIFEDEIERLNIVNFSDYYGITVELRDKLDFIEKCRDGCEMSVEDRKKYELDEIDKEFFDLYQRVFGVKDFDPVEQQKKCLNISIYQHFHKYLKLCKNDVDNMEQRNDLKEMRAENNEKSSEEIAQRVVKRKFFHLEDIVQNLKRRREINN